MTVLLLFYIFCYSFIFETVILTHFYFSCIYGPLVSADQYTPQVNSCLSVFLVSADQYTPSFDEPFRFSNAHWRSLSGMFALRIQDFSPFFFFFFFFNLFIIIIIIILLLLFEFIFNFQMLAETMIVSLAFTTEITLDFLFQKEECYL